MYKGNQKKAVLIYLEKELVKKLDTIAKKNKLSRTAFINGALLHIMEMTSNNGKDK